MSNTHDIVASFLEQESNSTLLMQGRWGVGKTYFWQKLVAAYSEKKRIYPEYYTYVSLFGINNISDLKNAILVGRLAANEIENKQNHWWTKSKGFSSKLENIPLLKNWTGGLVNEIAYDLIKDTLICFDDFERKGDDLSVKDIFGIVSNLKEQRNCKIALILNVDAIEPKELEQFKIHCEKVVDINFKFEQTPQKAFDAVFMQSDLYYDDLKQYCSSLDICNIRIIQRINRFYKEILSVSKKFDKDLLQTIFHSIVLFVWSENSKEDNPPPIDHILKYASDPIFSMTGDEINDHEKNWNFMLRNYGYKRSDKLENVLADFVRDGFLNKTVFLNNAQNRLETIHISRGHQNFSKVWELFHKSFDDNKAEFIEELTKSFRKNINYLNMNNVNSTARILRKLGHETLANELVDGFIFAHSHSSLFRDFSTDPFGYELTDSYLIQKYDEQFKKVSNDRTILSVLQKITGSTSWGQGDEDFLASLSEDDYYNFFKEEKSERLHSYIKRCLKFGLIGNANDNHLKIAKMAKDALIKIGKENTLNKIRIESNYDIKIED